MTISSTTSESLISNPNQQFIKPTQKKYNQRSSIQHWQLRDLLHSTTDSFYTVHQNHVLQYNLTNNQSCAIMRDLTYSPTSLTIGEGYLAAGGQRSQLMIRQLNSNWFAQTTVGGSINNALSIHSLPNSTNNNSQTRILVCNNDETIKVYELPSLQRVTTIGLPTAVNYAKVSSDGRRMCAVGDSNQVFVFEVTNGGYYQRISTLTTSNDAGFSCDFNQSSTQFAVASQDGIVSVFDMRYLSSNRKLCMIYGRQYPQVKGALRSIKYAHSPSVDLLGFTEHTNYINFLDTRTYDPQTMQSIKLNQLRTQSQTTADLHISGFCWGKDCKNVYVGLESGVLEFEVDIHKRRTFPKGERSNKMEKIQQRNQEASLYVGNLDERVTEELLWELFIQAAPIKSIFFPKDRISQIHQGFCFIEFQTQSDAEYVLKVMNLVKVFNKALRVNKVGGERKKEVGANLFIGGLANEVDEIMLQEAFSTFGVLIYPPKVGRDEMGQSKGYAFLSYDSFESADRAIEGMNGQWLCNKQIQVSYAFRKDGKGERHGSAAERLLAQQSRQQQK